jgi:chemotaxis signal transduction protein
LPVPQVKEFLLGIMNWQAEATWILDLAGLLGAVHWCKRSPIPQSGMAMLVDIENRKIGMIVEHIQGIETYNRQFCCEVSQISSPEPLRRFLQGYFLDKEGNYSMLLDVREIGKVFQS